MSFIFGRPTSEAKFQRFVTAQPSWEQYELVEAWFTLVVTWFESVRALFSLVVTWFWRVRAWSWLVCGLVALVVFLPGYGLS
jgi:hypothetical protein